MVSLTCMPIICNMFVLFNRVVFFLSITSFFYGVLRAENVLTTIPFSLFMSHLIFLFFTHL